MAIGQNCPSWMNVCRGLFGTFLLQNQLRPLQDCRFLFSGQLFKGKVIVHSFNLRRILMNFQDKNLSKVRKFTRNFGKLDLVFFFTGEGSWDWGIQGLGGWGLADLATMLSLYLIIYALTFTGSRRCFTVEIFSRKEYCVKLIGESLRCQLKFSRRSFPYWAGQKPIKDQHV